MHWLYVPLQWSAYRALRSVLMTFIPEMRGVSAAIAFLQLRSRCSRYSIDPHPHYGLYDELVTLRPLHLNFSVYPENCILCMKVTLWDLTSAYGRSGKFPPTRAKPPLTPDDITGVRDGMVRNLAVYLRTRCREH